MRRRLAYAALTAAVAILVVELSAWAAYRLLRGESFSYARLEQERQQVLQAVRPAADVAAQGDAAAPGIDDITAEREVLHPYLGFVFNPELNEREDRAARGELAINRYGFFQPPGRVDLPPPAEVDVGIFGGSAALLFCFQGADLLAERLAAEGPFAGKEVAVHCFALGGYKQPQQLMALSYFLALDRKLDVVVNLDGFNEVTLAWADNRPQQVAPHYPRKWKQRVAQLPDVEAQRLLGALVFARDRRAAWARFYSESTLRHSMAANVVWLAGDRALARWASRVEQAYSSYTPDAHVYRWQGPIGEQASPDDFFREQARQWATSSRLMHRLCIGSGIRYLHVLQPNQYLPGSKPLSERERETAYDQAGVAALAVRAGYPLLQEAGRGLLAEGVPFVDATGLFARVTEPLYVDPCCHWNEAGNRLLADEIFRHLARPTSQVD